jgi:hypothetical protein
MLNVKFSSAVELLCLNNARNTSGPAVSLSVISKIEACTFSLGDLLHNKFSQTAFSWISIYERITPYITPLLTIGPLVSNKLKFYARSARECVAKIFHMKTGQKSRVATNRDSSYTHTEKKTHRQKHKYISI